MYLKLKDVEGVRIEIEETNVYLEEAEVSVIGKVVDTISTEAISEGIKKIAEAMKGQFSKLGVSKTSLEFGISFSIESGQIISLITKGVAACNLKVTLEWEKE
jgi:hypothetical protein